MTGHGDLPRATPDPANRAIANLLDALDARWRLIEEVTIDRRCPTWRDRRNHLRHVRRVQFLRNNPRWIAHLVALTDDNGLLFADLDAAATVDFLIVSDVEKLNGWVNRYRTMVAANPDPKPTRPVPKLPTFRTSLDHAPTEPALPTPAPLPRRLRRPDRSPGARWWTALHVAVNRKTADPETPATTIRCGRCGTALAVAVDAVGVRLVAHFEHGAYTKFDVIAIVGNVEINDRPAIRRAMTTIDHVDCRSCGTTIDLRPTKRALLHQQGPLRRRNTTAYPHAFSRH